MSEQGKLNWDAARAHLAKVQALMDADQEVDPAALASVYRERATRLAQPQAEGEAPSAEAMILVFACGQERFGVLLPEVVEILPGARLAPVPGAPPQVAGVVQVRGDIRPVYDLAQLMGIASTGDCSSDSSQIILLRDGGLEAGIRASSVEGTRLEPAQSHREPPTGDPQVRWLTADLIPVLNVQQLLAERED